jgi:hypothetical protein
MENFLIQLLGKLLDKSKAKNPLVWFIVACLIALAQIIISNAGVWNVAISAEWLNALQTIVTVGGLLIGSRTTAFLSTGDVSPDPKGEDSGPQGEPSMDLPSESVLPPSLNLPPRKGRPRKGV